MSYEPTDVVVVDQNGSPIEGVIVRVLSPDGTVFFTQDTTDGLGTASFLLFTQDYSMRFYKFQATFPQPQMFTVEEAPAVNTFDVVGEVLVPPIATDSRLCRCSGYFRDSDGSPQKYLDMQFFAEFDPLLLEGAGIIPRRIRRKTDANGYVEIDLIRGANYRVSIEGMECADRSIRVPDLASANLPDVLFPVVAEVILDPEGPYTLAVGGELEITPLVLDSAGTPLTGTGQGDVRWSLSNTELASLVVGGTTLTITGLAAGAVELIAERVDSSIVVIPSTPITGQPASITIT